VPDEALVKLLRQRSLKFGDFTLSSGRRSPFYIDARLTTMSAAGLRAVGLAGCTAILEAGWEATLVGGLTLGADPVAYAIARESLEGERPMDAFTVRKQVKAHGTGRRIEGCFAAGARVIVVEDVITTGGSAIQAIEAVEQAGGEVAGVLAVVDRLEGGRAAIESAGYDVHALVTLRDLGVEVPAA